MMANLPLRIDEIERRPIVVVERLPECIVIINCDWMLKAYVLHGAANVINVVLECELRRVDADHHQSVMLVFLGPRADIRKCTLPIDAGIGAEIDQDDLAAQASCRQWR